MKTRSIAYAATTGLVALGFAFGGFADLMKKPEVVEGMTHLGYPAYVATLLGIWKVLGAAAIVAPGTARLKEFAYAGILFDLTGAAFSHAAAGDPVGKIVPPLVLLAFAVASYALRPASRSLGAPLVAEKSEGRALGAVTASAS